MFFKIFAFFVLCFESGNSVEYIKFENLNLTSSFGIKHLINVESVDDKLFCLVACNKDEYCMMVVSEAINDYRFNCYLYNEITEVNTNVFIEVSTCIYMKRMAIEYKSRKNNS